MGTAFIVLKSQQDLATVINLNDDSVFSRIINWIGEKLCCCCYTEENSISRIKHHFKRAPEPTDVFWDNLGVGKWRRLKNIILTYLATILLIGACFGIIYGLNVGKNDIDDSKGESIGEGTARGLSILCSLIITFINIMLRSVVRIFSGMERQETYTAYNISVAFKLTLARFVNTSIVPIVVNVTARSWFVNGGLVNDIFYIMLSISFVDPFLYYFDMFYILKLIRRKI